MNIAGGTHHAFYDRGEAFCMLNDQAIATNYIIQEGLFKKILIIDLMFIREMVLHLYLIQILMFILYHFMVKKIILSEKKKVIWTWNLMTIQMMKNISKC